MEKLNIFLICFFIVAPFLHAAEQEKLQTECVGRLTINFPYDAEIAGTSYDELKSQISEPNTSPQYSFSDGEIPWSGRIFYDGPILISNTMPSQQIASLTKYFVDERKRSIDFFKKNGISENNKVGNLVNLSKNTVAWNIGYSVNALISFKNGLLIYDFSKSKNLAENLISVRNFASEITHRKIFEVPPASGLCMPYVFFRTDNFKKRNVTASYKLIKYPDVTLWISESSSDEDPDSIRENNKQPKNIINSFWSQYETLKGVKNVEPLSLSKNGASINLAGRKGISSFVKIKREGGVEDYGYYASARGEAGNVNSPNIDIYVIRNSSFAGVGDPIDREEFMHIVDGFQTSVALKKN